MRLQRRDLDKAALAGVISAAQAESLWSYLSGQAAEEPGFRPAHILYYLGGLVAMAALSLFVTLAWEPWAGIPMLVVALAYAALGIALTHWFLQRGLAIPAGLTITFAVSTVPLAVYSLQHMLGFWEGERTLQDFHLYIDWRWFFMEVATLAAAAVALWRYRMPFTLFIVGVIFWYLSMDLVPLLFNDQDPDWQLREKVTLCMGILTTFLAFWVDVRSGRKRDYAFWLYLFGVAMFWGGLSLQRSDSELNKFLYLLINLGLLVVGAVLMRRVFAVFAAFGIIGYLGHLAMLFRFGLLFPVLLAAIGLGIMFLGVKWQRNERRIHDALLRFLPGKLRDLVLQAHGG
ncbi:MAG TPA: DUF2157 domain-containing protein [Gammaproteobacteria bacterium]